MKGCTGGPISPGSAPVINSPPQLETRGWAPNSTALGGSGHENYENSTKSEGFLYISQERPGPRPWPPQAPPGES